MTVPRTYWPGSSRRRRRERVVDADVGDRRACSSCRRCRSRSRGRRRAPSASGGRVPGRRGRRPRALAGRRVWYVIVCDAGAGVARGRAQRDGAADVAARVGERDGRVRVVDPAVGDDRGGGRRCRRRRWRRRGSRSRRRRRSVVSRLAVPRRGRVGRDRRPRVVRRSPSAGRRPRRGRSRPCRTTVAVSVTVALRYWPGSSCVAAGASVSTLTTFADVYAAALPTWSETT